MTIDDPFDPGGLTEHVPVLGRQVLALLDPKPGMVCLDCTVGLGGHAAMILPHLAPGGRYIGLDVDPENLAMSRKRLASSPVPVDLVRANFSTARAVLAGLDIPGVDLLLADLGFASNQMADPVRGLSFNVDAPLDMRLDPTLDRTAADLVNRLPEEQLANLIYQFGEERRSRVIARKIVEIRRDSPINTTGQLAHIVRRSYGPSAGRGKPLRRRLDPATRTFMALRIAVNDELTALQRLLDDLPTLLRPGAVAAVVSFHSLEDRLVKRAFSGFRGSRQAQTLTRKPLTADNPERRENPRSRSAKLRAVRWIEGHAEAAAG